MKMLESNRFGNANLDTSKFPKSVRLQLLPEYQWSKDLGREQRDLELRTRFWKEETYFYEKSFLSSNKIQGLEVDIECYV